MKHIVEFISLYDTLYYYYFKRINFDAFKLARTERLKIDRVYIFIVCFIIINNAFSDKL